jgi:hypothetical protein
MTSDEYLVHHGCAGHLGRFRAADRGGFGRGVAVVVQSCRGLELGEVLCLSTPDRPLLPDPLVGELLRAATCDDIAASGRYRELGQRLFDDGARLTEIRGLPLALMDVEVFLDGRQALLHAVRLGAGDEGPLLEELGERHGLILRMYDLAAEPAAADDHDEGGCGSCGEGGCGSCGTGGCGSCSAGGAKELTQYFAALRGQMEQKQRVPLL